MPVRSIDLLRYQSLSRVVDNIQPNRNFLTRLFFPPSTVETLPTETVELSSLEGDAEIAPFVKANAASIMVGGDSETFAQVEAPNIRISRVLEASALLFNRSPGEVIFSGRAAQQSNAERKIAQALRRLNDRIVNTLEYMVAQLLRGQINYAVADGANFTITLPRSVLNDITLTGVTFWDNGSAPHPLETFDYAKLRISTLGLPTEDVILGEEAYLHFTRNAEVKASLKTDTGITTGGLSLIRQFSRVGALPVGTYMGVRIWRYPRSVIVNGVDFPLIRPKYAEFLSATPEAEHTLFYGAIPDMEALEGRRWVGTRFSKSWTTKDPSVRKMLVHSRPLPWFKRADSVLSAKVISG